METVTHYHTKQMKHIFSSNQMTGSDLNMMIGKKTELGFTSLEKEISVDRLPVKGKIPEWLSGTLMRNGPAKFDLGKQGLRQWFDGLAMLHNLSFIGGNVSYANRFIKSNAYSQAKERGRISYREFATDPCRSIFKRVSSMFSPSASDNANVNVTRIGGKFIAMTETPIPIEHDPVTLDTVGLIDYDDNISGSITTAHPQHDYDGKRTFNYLTHFSPKSWMTQKK